MATRTYGSPVLNESFGQSAINEVWMKGFIVYGVDPNFRRKDSCGAWIDYNQYGDTTVGGTGWEIDHIFPVSKGGGDNLENLQPLQWQNNRGKGDVWPNWVCSIKA